MKSIKYIILIATMLHCALQASPYDNMPQIPPPDKKIADYTPQDVVGCYFGKNKAQPKEHPLRVKDPEAKIKADWPGAKTPASADVIIGHILLADSPLSDERISEVIYAILWDTMDVPKSDIAAAFARVYAAQTEQTAKRKVAFLGRYLFPWLADERVLAPLKDMLDDSSMYESKKLNEGGWVQQIRVRLQAYWEIYGYIHDSSLLQIGLPEGQFIVSATELSAMDTDNVDEATACQRMKAWLDSHWTEVATKCAEIRTKPDSEREFRGPSSYRLLTPLTPEPNR